MKKVNLRDLYPDVYKTDHFVEVTEDVLETIRDSERAEAAYDDYNLSLQMNTKLYGMYKPLFIKSKELQIRSWCILRAG